MFAPVGRGTPGHPDRGRQRHGRQEDGPFAGAQPVRHQQGDQAQHVVPVQRERVLTAVPAETAEDGPVDGPLLHRGPRPAQGRPAQAKPRKPYRLSCDRLWSRVAEWLGCGWSPLPVSGRLRVLFPDDPIMRVCPETVYRWIYSSKPRRARWARCLPRGHRRRRKRMGRKASRFPIPGRVSISRRPPEADDRSGFGHWEADGAVGVGCDPHTEVERRTRCLMASVVPDKTAGESVGTQPAMSSPLPAGARRRHARQRHRVRPPHTRRGIRRRAAKLARQTRMLHF
ncbi:IS30 family transposase [Bifidobacterium breve]|uniref:IS30 family transposase n=1 Tax=Bifidobacterium breve TaxID=1685 RepID=UPI0030F456F2